MNARDWFERRTFHHRDFEDLDALVEAKKRQELTISVCIPTLNEGTTIGPIIETIAGSLLGDVPLVDELVIIDSASADDTAAVAARAGATVFQDHEVLPELERYGGKGDAMWKSLFVLKGDLIVWVDADVQNFHPRFIYGLLGPLLTVPEVGYVKGFYERPLGGEKDVDPLGGGRVTELMARPLLNALRPELAGLVQPLAGEYAGRREMLAGVPFFTGYAVEIGLIMDIASTYGLDAIGQVDLDRRIHRNRPMHELSPMAFAILQAALKRLETTGQLELNVPIGDNMLLFSKENGDYDLREAAVPIHERPPASTVPGYPARG